MSVPKLIDQHGNELSSRSMSARASSFKAASVADPDLGTWSTANPSPQSAISMDRAALAGRIHDLARNDGWASGGVSRIIDAVIGGNWRLSSRPNWQALGITPEQSEEVAAQFEAKWKGWAEDIDMRCDAGERLNWAGLLALGFRHRIWDGETFAVLHWVRRSSFYRTAVEIIHPDRVSNPDGRLDEHNLREGVELNRYGAPEAYYVRKAHPGDWAMGVRQFEWVRVRKRTSWGRRVVVHAFEPGAAGEVRGISPIVTVMKKIRMIARYDEIEMQAAIVNAIMAAFIQTPHDAEQIANAMNAAADGNEAELSAYQNFRADYYDKVGALKIPGAQVNFLAPGEQAILTNPNHPNSVFEQFERAALRNIATAIGVSYEQLSMDWSQVNYSSARAALIEIWRGFNARKGFFATQFAQPIYAAVLEEMVDRGEITFPAGAPSFYEARNAWCAAQWVGPGRGWVDPQKEAKAAEIRLQAGLTTLEDECAEQGKDWQEVLQQRARERSYAGTLSLPDPHSGGQQRGGTVDEVIGERVDEAVEQAISERMVKS